MVKKRQADFPKVHLKPGRPVSRKKNDTDTSFKAKKICIQPNRGLKDQNQFPKTIGEHLQTMKPTSKSKDFDELRKLIVKEKHSLPNYFPDIFNYLFKIILEGHSDDNQRNAAVENINTVLVETTDLQLHSFIPRFTNFLSCAMTHTSIRIKEQSLKVLNAMLQTHPNLICNSMDILTNLLQMLTGAPRKWIHSQSSTKSHGRSSLEVMYSDSVYSPDWRVHVLGHINLFLTEMLKEKSVVEDPNRDQQEVYWDCKAPLYLQIYAGSGLKPIDIEKSLPTDYDNKDFYFDDSGSAEAFIESIITLIPEVFIEEMTSESKYDDDLVSRGNIVNLSILFQVLSKVCEWMHLISFDEMDASVKKFLQDSVWSKEDRFPFFQRGASVQDVSAVRLNLAVSFLFVKFLLDDDNEALNNKIIHYITKTVFKASFAIRYESIPMIVKIMKVYFGKQEIPEVMDFLKACLAQLCSLLKGNNENTNEQLLLSLFIKMNLDSAYRFLANSDGMKHFFNWLFHQLMDIPKTKDKSKIDRNFLHVVKKIANRKNKYFLELLQKNDAKVIKGLLNYDNDDVRDAAIFLIYNMEYIPTSLFHHVHRLISDSKFPTRMAVRFIRLLTCRFLEKRATEEPGEESMYDGRSVLDFIMFLLNISIDYSSVVSEKWTDYEDNKYTKAMKIYKDAIAYIVFPSLHWKEHSVLFDACHKSLMQLHKSLVKAVAAKLIKEILDNTTVLPMHSAIAILRLFKYKKIDSYLRYQLSDLKFCALLITSILTQMLTEEEECYTWSEMVEELMNSIELDHDTALETLTHVQYLKDDQIEGIVGYHILKVIKFYLEKQLLAPKDYKAVLKIMEILKNKTSEKTFGQQPLYITLCRHLCGKSYYS